MQNADRYLKIAYWLQKRYTVDGKLILSTGLIPSTYSKLELLAFKKYILEG